VDYDELLTSNTLNLSLRNACGQTPFHLAASQGHKELVAQMADFSDRCVFLEDYKV